MLDNLYAYRFAYLLSQRWEDTDAFKLGIVDENGKQLKKMNQLKTSEEKSAYTRFHHLVYNIKRLLQRLPGSQSTIGRLASAMLLLKEETGFDFSNIVSELVDIPMINQIILESEADKYTYMFGVAFECDNGECVIANSSIISEDISTAGFDFGGSTSRKARKKPVEETETFAGNVVFVCDPETFAKCRLGKRRYARYNRYFGLGEMGDKIKDFAYKNPNKNIILKNSMTGSMLYFRKVT